MFYNQKLIHTVEMSSLYLIIVPSLVQKHEIWQTRIHIDQILWQLHFLARLGWTKKTWFRGINCFLKILTVGLTHTIIHDCNGTPTHNHLFRKQTLNYLAKLASLTKWLSVCLRTKWLWVRVPLQSLKLQISRKDDTQIRKAFQFFFLTLVNGEEETENSINYCKST